jgi:hypothetical protein
MLDSPGWNYLLFHLRTEAITLFLFPMPIRAIPGEAGICREGNRYFRMGSSTQSKYVPSANEWTAKRLSSSISPRFGECFHLKMTDKEFDAERQLLRCTFDLVEETESVVPDGGLRLCESTPRQKLDTHDSSIQPHK